MASEGGDPPCWAEQVCDRCGRIAEGPHECTPAVSPVLRTITGFHQDDVGDWVAELSCFHNQHVRHRPPFQLRPWVVNADDRAARVGGPLECPPCGRAELPDGLVVVRTAGPFDATTVPAGLLRDHRLADGVWGRLHVDDGSLSFTMQTEPPVTTQIHAGDDQPIPPGIRHALHLPGAVSFTIEFLTPPSQTPGEGST
jgi:tellurite methyltransferase